MFKISLLSKEKKNTRGKKRKKVRKYKSRTEFLCLCAREKTAREHALRDEITFLKCV